MTSLQIGKAIYSILAQNGINKVYPLVADEGTTFPFIVYRRIGLTPSSTKDRYNYREMATVELIVASASYESGVELAEQVKGILVGKRGTFNEIQIGEIYLEDADEDFLEDTFVQKLTFNIEII